MRKSTTVLVVTLIALLSTDVVVIGQSPDPSMANFMGTWKLNVAKSTYDTGTPPKSQISKWEPWEGGYRNTIDATNAQGQATHSEWAGKFDGKDYPFKGTTVAANATRAYTRIDERNYEYVDKVDGKVTTTVRAVMARDGKTRTLTTTGKNVQGQPVHSVAVYDKQ